MALTTRQDILNQIVYQVGTPAAITTAVSAGKRNVDSEPFTPAECPAVVVSYGKHNRDELISQDEHHLDIKLEILTSSRLDSAQVEDLFQMLADVVSANPTWSGYADGSSGTTPDTDDIYEVGDIISSGSLTFTVHYTTAKGGL